MKILLCGLILGVLPVAVGPVLYAQNPIIEAVQHSDWRYTKLESLYSLNQQAIQDQLTSVGKQLNHLSVVDPPVYAGLQQELQELLKQLASYPPDYGQPDTYQLIRLKLIRLNDRIKAAFADERRTAFERTVPSAIDDTTGLRGKDVLLWPYAILFRKPDYHTRIQYVLPAGEVVRILSVNRDYVRVRYRHYEGYISLRMIKERFSR